MKRITLALIGAAALALGACTNGTSDTLSDGRVGNGDGTGTAGSEETTFDHSNDPGASSPGADTNPATEPAQIKIVGSPEVTSRLHGCGKISLGSLGSILTSRGLTGGGTRPAGQASGRRGGATNSPGQRPGHLHAERYGGSVRRCQL